MNEVWKPKVISGGKDGGILLPNPDWLWSLDVGTVFFCKAKKTPIFLQLFIVAAKMEEEGNRFMRLENPENSTNFIAVDTRDFSKEFSYHMTLPGVDDGTSDTVDGSGLAEPSES